MCEKWLGGVSGEYQYASQFGQDWWLYNHIFKHYPPGYRGVYVELGAFQPVKESNSYFFDKCLGWEGLCIEPQPVNVAGFVGRRSCTLVPFCVSDRERVVKFVSFKGSYYAGSGLGKVEDAETTELFRRSANASWEQTYEIEIVCFSLKQLFSHYNVRHVDYLSLDVEGYEENAIFGVDFSKVQIDVITIEGSSSGSRAAQYLAEQYGYEMVRGVYYNRLALVDFVLVAPGFRGFKCGEKLSRLDTYRSCPPNPNDSPDFLARHTLCRT
jgi:FkbM family methyltransferase